MYSPNDIIFETIQDDYIIQIPKFFAKYVFVKTLGKGSFAAVILVQHVITKNLYACKIVSRKFLQQMNIFLRFEQEVRIMQTMNHPRIVKLEEVIYDPENIYLVLEYCPHGDLFQQICKCGAYNEEKLRVVFREIVEALDYIHSKNVAHRDLKPENILLDENYMPKIADFGLCHELSAKKLLMTPCGSPFYAPPEIIRNEKYDGKMSDIWSLGVVLFTMATGALPWTEPNQTALFLQIENCDFKIPPEMSPPVQQLVQMMMVKNPKDRPSTKELLNHPWLAVDDDMATMKPTSLKASKQIGLIAQSLVEKSFVSKSMKRPLIIRPEKKNSSSLKANELPPISSLIRKVPPKKKVYRQSDV